MIHEYYRLVKPGIIYGNLLNVAGAFLLASRGSINFILFAITLLGIALIIASGCVFNNYLDRDIDAQMERTKKRALVRGTISGNSALIFASVLGILGAISLLFTNLLTLVIALFGLFAYVCLYSLWSKRYTVHSTLIGAISGAIPPVVGYCAVTNSLDTGAIILFLILAAWQLPHAFAIAVYRFDDYKAAAIPVLPVQKGIFVTKVYMALSTGLFFCSILSLYLFGYTGIVYLIALSALSFAWLALSIAGFFTSNDTLWGQRMFLLSLVIIFSFCVLIAIDWSL